MIKIKEQSGQIVSFK